MKIMAIEKEVPGVEDHQYQPFLQDEAWRVWELQQTGSLREFYFTQDTHCAVLILECQNSGEASQLLQTLPLVQNGLIDFEIHPLVPYSGLARLFSPRSPK